jgi:hypothetical protein
MEAYPSVVCQCLILKLFVRTVQGGEVFCNANAKIAGFSVSYIDSSQAYVQPVVGTGVFWNDTFFLYTCVLYNYSVLLGHLMFKPYPNSAILLHSKSCSTMLNLTISLNDVVGLRCSRFSSITECCILSIGQKKNSWRFLDGETREKQWK